MFIQTCGLGPDGGYGIYFQNPTNLTQVAQNIYSNAKFGTGFLANSSGDFNALTGIGNWTGYKNIGLASSVGLHFHRSAGNSHVTAIQILDNQMSTYQNPGSTLIKVEDDGTVWRGAQVRGNFLIVNNGGTGIDLHGGLSWVLDDNDFYNPFNPTGGTVNLSNGIVIGSTAVKPEMGVRNRNTDGSVSSFFSNASSSIMYHTKVEVLGGYNVNCSSVSGSLYYGQMTVSWPAGLFNNRPSVSVNVKSGAIGGAEMEGSDDETSADVRIWAHANTSVAFEVYLTGN